MLDGPSITDSQKWKILSFKNPNVRITPTAQNLARGGLSQHYVHIQNHIHSHKGSHSGPYQSKRWQDNPNLLVTRNTDEGVCTGDCLTKQSPSVSHEPQTGLNFAQFTGKEVFVEDGAFQVTLLIGAHFSKPKHKIIFR